MWPVVNYCVILLSFKCRSTPVECLHTLLLGPFKYITEHLMNRLTASQKCEVQSKIRGFDFTPFQYSLSPGVCHHYLSFHGRDFKILAQVCLFTLWDHLLPAEKQVWLSLCKVHSPRWILYTKQYQHETLQVFQIAYCEQTEIDEVESRCQDLIKHVKALDDSFLTRPKFHLLLHLADNVREFGPTSAYNTEKYIHVLCHQDH